MLILHVPDLVHEDEPVRIVALSREPSRVPGIYVELHLVAWQSGRPFLHQPAVGVELNGAGSAVEAVLVEADRRVEGEKHSLRMGLAPPA